MMWLRDPTPVPLDCTSRLSHPAGVSPIVKQNNRRDDIDMLRTNTLRLQQPATAKLLLDLALQQVECVQPFAFAQFSQSVKPSGPRQPTPKHQKLVATNAYTHETNKVGSNAHIWPCCSMFQGHRRLVRRRPHLGGRV